MHSTKTLRYERPNELKTPYKHLARSIAICYLTRRSENIMALIERSLIWVTYAVALGILFFIAGIFVFVFQKPSERSAGVTIVCFITVFAALATVLLMPVDIALTSSTTDRKLGRKKDWADPDTVDSIQNTLQIVYYALYSLDAVLCLLVVPFTFFLYEEYDEVDAEEGRQTLGGRLWGALKYTIGFVIIVLVLFLVGFFIPVSEKAYKQHKDLIYFKDLLRENRTCNDVEHGIDTPLIHGRWRTSLDLRSRHPDSGWYYHILPIHSTWPGSPSTQPY